MGNATMRELLMFETGQADERARLAPLVAAARAWDARICWEHTEADDEERALHEAVRALDERGEGG